MERGYVKLWRKTLESGIIENPHAWQLFGYLMMSAVHKERRFTSNGVIVLLNAGDAIFSRNEISKKLKMSERNARTALDFLKRMEIVTTKVTNRFTIVSFVNWGTYQQERPANRPADCPTGVQQVTSNRPTGDHYIKNVRMEECKNKESGDPSPTSQKKQVRFIPPSVAEVAGYANAMGKVVDAQRFCDFYDSKNWMVGKNKMSNWKAAVSGWIRREEERRQNTLIPFASQSRDPNRCVALPKPEGWK